MKNKLRYRIMALALVAVMMFTVMPIKEVSAAEDYRGWSQADSRWGSVSMGSTTVKRSGCLATSVTKLIIQAGIKDADSFNVKTFVKWMRSHGGFTGGGALCWDKPAKYAGFTYYNNNLMSYSTYSSKGNNTKLLNYLKKGYHLLIAVKGAGHWVAVDELKSLQTGKIYIMDSASSTQSKNKNITLQSKYSTFNRVAAYKGGKTAKQLLQEYNDKKAAEEIKSYENAVTLEGAVVTGLEDKIYTGKSLKQDNIAVTLGETQLVKDEDYKVTYKNNKNIGQAEVIITGIKNYKDTVTATFNINVAEGKTYTVSKMKYKVTNAAIDGTGTVALTGTTKSKKSLTSLTVGNTVKIGGKTFRITEIGKKAFYKYSKLKKITIKSKFLTSVGKNAIKGINKKAVIKVPKANKKAYKKLFTAQTGFAKKTMKIK